jgi:hypothetical protein
MTEKEFQRLVVQLASLGGWDYYFTWNSLHSPAGFPDLVLVRGPVILYRELKVGKNTTTSAQEHWINILRIARQDVKVWRPEDWSEIEATLIGRKR